MRQPWELPEMQPDEIPPPLKRALVFCVFVSGAIVIVLLVVGFLNAMGWV